MEPRIARAAWGARPARRPAAPLRPDCVVVHHTTDPNTYTPEDVPGLIRAIQALHMDERGWDDIGYNLVIDRFGRAYAGRSGVGAHTFGHNHRSLGVALLGDFSASPPSTAAVAALRAAGADLPVVAHRELGETECPGRAFGVELWRGR